MAGLRTPRRVSEQLLPSYAGDTESGVVRPRDVRNGSRRSALHDTAWATPRPHHCARLLDYLRVDLLVSVDGLVQQGHRSGSACHALGAHGPGTPGLDQSSDVQGIVSLYGASNLLTILPQSTESGLKMRVPALQLLLGAQPSEKPDLAKLASPVAHLDKNDPPLLLIHGDADPQMPPQQSQEFAKAYEALGLPVKLVMIQGAKHGGAAFYDDERTRLVVEFLDKALR